MTKLNNKEGTNKDKTNSEIKERIYVNTRNALAIIAQKRTEPKDTKDKDDEGER